MSETDTEKQVISFFVPGIPVPKARPRVTKFGNTYTPKRTVTWEKDVADVAKTVMGDREPVAGPVRLILDFTGARPNADLDNLIKAVEDALNGICYVDDHQIFHLGAIRWPKQPGGNGVNITIWLM